MIKIDKSALTKAENRSAPYKDGLLDYAEKVALEKPKCTLMVDDDCVSSHFKHNSDGTHGYDYDISAIILCDEGERVGAISINTEYREGKETVVYGVESFRIQKYRGNANRTVSKHLNVALRNVKKYIKGRDYSELATLIKENVSTRINSLRQMMQSRVCNALNTDQLAVELSMLAYQARKAGKEEFTVSSLLAPKNMRYTNDLAEATKKHDKYCEGYKDAFVLSVMLNDKKGYGVSMYSNGSLAVYSFANDEVRKYQAVSELDPLMQTRLAMFKMTAELEPYEQFGCKFEGDMYYIVEGDMDLQS
ncbi:MAG: hypothetical protein WCK82_05310 [Bacteroidota bacterium]